MMGKDEDSFILGLGRNAQVVLNGNFRKKSQIPEEFTEFQRKVCN